MAVDLKNHPGVNPEYFRDLEARKQAQRYNRMVEAGALIGMGMPVPKHPNKYLPHIGAKQRAKGAK